MIQKLMPTETTAAFSRIFLAAQGFIELGMWQDAWDELESSEH